MAQQVMALDSKPDRDLSLILESAEWEERAEPLQAALCLHTHVVNLQVYPFSLTLYFVFCFITCDFFFFGFVSLVIMD